MSAHERLPRLLSVLLCILCAVCCAGCPQDTDLDQKGAHQSLIEIGERAVEQGESLESEGRAAEAHAAYRRALWAFRYHRHLTGEEPFLLDEAVDGAERTGRR